MQAAKVKFKMREMCKYTDIGERRVMNITQNTNFALRYSTVILTELVCDYGDYYGN